MTKLPNFAKYTAIMTKMRFFRVILPKKGQNRPFFINLGEESHD